MHNLAPCTQRNRSLLRDMYPANGIADQPPRTDRMLLVRYIFGPPDRIQEPAQHPTHRAPQERNGPAQYQ